MADLGRVTDDGRVDHTVLFEIFIENLADLRVIFNGPFGDLVRVDSDLGEESAATAGAVGSHRYVVGLVHTERLSIGHRGDHDP